MTNQNFPRRLLDDAIDRAVHEMMHADPRPGLRRRVLGKLNAPARRIKWIPHVLVPAAACAALVLAVVLMRPASTTPVAPQTAASGAAAAEPTAPSAPDSQSPAAAATDLRAGNVAQTAPPRSRARRTGVARRDEPAAFVFGPRSDRVAATNVPLPPDAESAADGAEVPHAFEQPPLEITPLAGPAPIVLPPIEIKAIVFRPAPSR